jgi:hypothetical protein
MLKKKQLKRLLNIPDSELTIQEYAGKRSALARGLPYYGVLRSMYPQHFSSFGTMHWRLQEGTLACDFPRDAEGFIDFLVYLGDVPAGMNRPSLGRDDHSVGYVRGNFAWQEMSENSSESVQRNRDYLNEFVSKGEGKPNAILNEELVRKIRRYRDKKLKRGWNRNQVSNAIHHKLSDDVSLSTVKDVVYDRKWKGI